MGVLRARCHSDAVLASAAVDVAGPLLYSRNTRVRAVPPCFAASPGRLVPPRSFTKGNSGQFFSPPPKNESDPDGYRPAKVPVHVQQVSFLPCPCPCRQPPAMSFLLYWAFICSSRGLQETPRGVH